MTQLDQRQGIQKGDYDVLVAGGGVAGISAAVASAREGAKTLLMEKSIVLGGLATAGLISWYEPLCDGCGQKMIGGISEELLLRSIEYGFDDLPGHWRDGKGSGDSKKRYATHFSPTLFAMALDEYLAENGVELVLDALVTDPVMDGGHCSGLMAETREGRVYYGAKTIVDATGDALVFQRAGAPTVVGDNYMTYCAHYTDRALAQKFAEDGNMARFRKWSCAGSDLFGKGHPAGMALFQGETAEQITEFVRTGRKLLFDKLKESDRNQRDVTMLPFMPQYRTIRHMEGASVFKGEDLDVKFEDAIGSCGDFRKPGSHYQIPYSCLYHPDVDNLLAAGRIISTDKEGWEVTRVIPVAALTGQAAGTAAALSAGKCPVSKIDMKLLQQKLKESGVLFV